MLRIELTRNLGMLSRSMNKCNWKNRPRHPWPGRFRLSIRKRRAHNSGFTCRRPLLGLSPRRILAARCVKWARRPRDIGNKKVYWITWKFTSLALLEAESRMWGGNWALWPGFQLLTLMIYSGTILYLIMNIWDLHRNGIFSFNQFYRMTIGYLKVSIISGWAFLYTPQTTF